MLSFFLFLLFITKTFASLPHCKNTTKPFSLCVLDEGYSVATLPQPFPCNVTINFHVLDIIDIDENDQIVKLKIALEFRWIDSRLGQVSHQHIYHIFGR